MGAGMEKEQAVLSLLGVGLSSQMMLQFDYLSWKLEALNHRMEKVGESHKLHNTLSSVAYACHNISFYRQESQAHSTGTIRQLGGPD